ncbi:hypothetical protein N665_0162s0061 [Sinapis alba]|nr:hypothetical protein N665_0162s0061 [Sinapis alba]
MDSYPSTGTSKFVELLNSQQTVSFEASHCNQRWHKINDLVCKFCGSYEAASREKSSGQNENDVLKLAYQIFYNYQKKKFTLEHAWKELQNDQKWCDLATAKNDGSSKKRKCEDGADSSTSQATENKRPPGVKAAKTSGKKTVVEENSLNEFQSMWTIKQQDLAMKERLHEMSLLESLIGKKEPLAAYEDPRTTSPSIDTHRISEQEEFEVCQNLFDGDTTKRSDKYGGEKEEELEEEKKNQGQSSAIIISSLPFGKHRALFIS